MARKRVGELLVEQGTITRAQLEAGLVLQQRSRQKLGITLIQQGAINERQLAQVLAESLGFVAVDLRQAPIDWSAVHMLRSRFCEAHELFPFGIEGKGSSQKKLMVALSDPLNQPAIDEIEFTTGFKVLPFVGTHSQVREAIVRYYHKSAAAPGLESVPVVAGHELDASQRAPLAPRTTSPSPGAKLGQPLAEHSRAGPPSRTPGDAAHDSRFELLFNPIREGDEGIEQLERRFWALLRILHRKGVVGREELLAEFGKDD
jgi:hypothetical protein